MLHDLNAAPVCGIQTSSWLYSRNGIGRNGVAASGRTRRVKEGIRGLVGSIGGRAWRLGCPIQAVSGRANQIADFDHPTNGRRRVSDGDYTRALKRTAAESEIYSRKGADGFFRRCLRYAPHLHVAEIQAPRQPVTNEIKREMRVHTIPPLGRRRELVSIHACSVRAPHSFSSHVLFRVLSLPHAHN